MKTTCLLSMLAIPAFLCLVSCKKEYRYEPNAYYGDVEYDLISKHLKLPEAPFSYALEAPFGIVLQTNQRTNDNLATLGRVLFYDTNLSKDKKVSCAGCHKQELAFGDDQALSPGVFGRMGARNSIALASVPSFAAAYGTDLNGAGAKRFFWDNRAPTARAQSRASMENPVEMDLALAEAVQYLQSTPFYKPLFVKAFGDETVTESRIMESIAGFVNAMRSVHSRFDYAVSQEIRNGNAHFLARTPPAFSFSRLTPEENSGRRLFAAHCSGCHGDNMLNSFVESIPDVASNGLDAHPADPGAGAFTGRPGDVGAFKPPTLRNIRLSAPYMHDGRFKTLEAVLEFYSTGIQAHANLHPLLKDEATGKPKRFNFTETEKRELLAFLSTLTDEKVLTDVRFSDPFRR